MTLLEESHDAIDPTESPQEPVMVTQKMARSVGARVNNGELVQKKMSCVSWNIAQLCASCGVMGLDALDCSQPVVLAFPAYISSQLQVIIPG